MPRKRRSEPDPVEAAHKAGADYAHEQLAGSYFQDWVWEQMVEAERMRQADPNSVIDASTPAGARKVAKNMLQQLKWDTKRALKESKEFFEGFDEVLQSQSSIDWLADMILDFDKEAREKTAPEAREARTETMTPEQRDTIVAALHHYGGGLSSDGFITHGEKVLSVRPEVKKGRLRMVAPDGNVLATYPVSKLASGVADFVERFWYWKPVGAETREASGRCQLAWSRTTQASTATGAKGLFKVESKPDGWYVTLDGGKLGVYAERKGAERAAERFEADESIPARREAAEAPAGTGTREARGPGAPSDEPLDVDATAWRERRGSLPRGRRPDPPSYVESVPGEGGVDWGYTVDYRKARLLSPYWQRRFRADMERVGARARFIPAHQNASVSETNRHSPRNRKPVAPYYSRKR